jgi:hypothetical protein
MMHKTAASAVVLLAQSATRSRRDSAWLYLYAGKPGPIPVAIARRVGFADWLR